MAMEIAKDSAVLQANLDKLVGDRLTALAGNQGRTPITVTTMATTTTTTTTTTSATNTNYTVMDIVATIKVCVVVSFLYLLCESHMILGQEAQGE
jgi:hypothetical protein